MTMNLLSPECHDLFQSLNIIFSSGCIIKISDMIDLF